ncbi:hypothetical protein [Actinoplanes sp. TFC3]|uniref:hypothetical protein n=1 Tax=Actinoplanes sp. TFC3 TaxID=1710355 RepID=UPI00083685F3|nr:hypothetical protein [Actinoplanes sp. TFC3]
MSDVPSAAEVKVATDVLRREAGVWDEQSAGLRGLSSKVGAMEFGRLEAGLFQLMVGPYNDVVRAVSSRAQEGATALTDIGTTRRSVANTYDAEDNADEHRIRNAY